MGDGPTLYEVLQVDRRASPDVIAAAYRSLARKCRPDVSPYPYSAEARIREINAAYEVLRHPARRVAYDRQLQERGLEASLPAADNVGSEDWEDDVGEGLLACRRHPRVVAVRACDCGAGMCDACFARFQPAMCAGCVLADVSRRKSRIAFAVIWFLAVVALVAPFLVKALDQRAPLSEAGPAAAVALIGYVIASFPTGWMIARPDFDGADDDDLLGALRLALVVGPIVAPFRMLKLLFWDLPNLRRLESLARAT